MEPEPFGLRTNWGEWPADSRANSRMGLPAFFQLLLISVNQRQSVLQNFSLWSHVPSTVAWAASPKSMINRDLSGRISIRDRFHRVEALCSVLLGFQPKKSHFLPNLTWTSFHSDRQTPQNAIQKRLASHPASIPNSTGSSNSFPGNSFARF